MSVLEETLEAIERADRAATAAWKREAFNAVLRTALRLPDFISDDVWETEPRLDEPREARALGPVMLRVARAGYIRKTDRMRPSIHSHLSGKPVWESLVTDGRK
jgi:hypothetical protein